MKIIIFSTLLLFSVEALGQFGVEQYPMESLLKDTSPPVSPPYTKCVKWDGNLEIVGEIEGQTYYRQKCLVQQTCRQQALLGQQVNVSCFCRINSSITRKRIMSSPVYRSGDTWDIAEKNGIAVCEVIIKEFLENKKRSNYNTSLYCLGEKLTGEEICTEPISVSE